MWDIERDDDGKPVRMWWAGPQAVRLCPGCHKPSSDAVTALMATMHDVGGELWHQALLGPAPT